MRGVSLCDDETMISHTCCPDYAKRSFSLEPLCCILGLGRYSNVSLKLSTWVTSVGVITLFLFKFIILCGAGQSVALAGLAWIRGLLHSVWFVIFSRLNSVWSFELLLNLDIGELLDSFLSSPCSSPCQACVDSPRVQTQTNLALAGVGACKLHISSSALLAL